MKSFIGWMTNPDLVVEVYTKCNSCGNKGGCSNFVWNAGKARCKVCGGSVDKIEPKKQQSPKDIVNPDVHRPGGFRSRARAGGGGISAGPYQGDE
jgi:hypothetical protein